LIVAYSTVAQIGYLFLVFSLAAEPAAAWDAWSATACFALAHACAKAAAFMAAGALQYATGSDDIDALAGIAQDQPIAVFAFAVAGVSLIGLPPSGAFLAKWFLLESALASGHWCLALAILLGGVLAAIYVFRVVARTLVAAEGRIRRRVPRRMQFVPLMLALVSVALGVVANQAMHLLEIGAPFSPMLPGGTP
jgi:formate hydrogenlyase subunit 3/multisubunit Na+/H+ antiporter MnhD subunit